MFTTPFPDTNGRSCATCHVAADNFALTATHAQQVWEANPNDPLFSAVDADDPTAEVLTYKDVKRGLIRVWLALPMTMDVIDDDGNVITIENAEAGGGLGQPPWFLVTTAAIYFN